MDFEIVNKIFNDIDNFCSWQERILSQIPLLKSYQIYVLFLLNK